MDKEKTLLDLHPKIINRIAQLCFENPKITEKEALEQAKKEMEGVIECQKKN